MFASSNNYLTLKIKKMQKFSSKFNQPLSDVLRQVMKIAYVNTSKHNLNRSDALKKAWKHFKATFEGRKNESEVRFIKKSTGKERVLRFTTNLESIPVEKHPKKEVGKIVGFARVFDLEIAEWRSFHSHSLIV